MNANVRNFCIIAHIDHGKSTLADRILEAGGAVAAREMQEQLLDSMDLERERGITIKAQSVRIPYKHPDTGELYTFNLIDTPGHVDFTYEVSRSLAACEGALLVVDAVQSVQAQTLANVYMALDANLEIVPVINKIDLPSARADKVREDIEDLIGLDASNAVLVSAKTGLGVPDLMKAIVARVPPPKGDAKAPLRALIFDSWFDPYQGAIVLTRVMEGEVRKGARVTLMREGRKHEVLKVGVFTPRALEVASLAAGDVGFIVAGIREVADAKVGDTITETDRPCAAPLPGFKEVKPMVFAGLYPTDSTDYPDLRDALEKLKLNDASFSYEPETSQALGFGFRLGFLGLLHMEIIQERLEREYDLSLITTAPTVSYRVTLTGGDVIVIDNPAKYPSPQKIETIEEPILSATIYTPAEYLGGILALCEGKRGVQRDMQFLTRDRVTVKYELPLNEIVLDFYDKLKSLSRGYASLEYEFLEMRPSDLVKLDLLINGESVDSLSQIVHREKAYNRGRALCEKMKEQIHRQLFEVVIQAAVGTKVIARSRVAPLRKDVTAKCYGGDITRKRKLLEKQKEGKKRMKAVGKIELPQEAFLAVLKVDD